MSDVKLFRLLDRCTLRRKCFRRIVISYKNQNNLWESYLPEYKEPKTKIPVIGVQSQRKKFDFSFH